MGSGLNLRFPGQYADSESGLSYNYFRDYEAGTGRYVESDPIRLRGGVSTFGYVRARPLNLIDEKGLGSGIGAFWNCINGPRPTDCGGGGRPAGGEGRQGYGGASPFKPPVPQSQSDSGFVCQSFFCFSVGLFEVCNPLGPLRACRVLSPLRVSAQDLKNVVEKIVTVINLQKEKLVWVWANF